MLSDVSVKKLRELFKPGTIFTGVNGSYRKILRIEDDEGGPYVVYAAGGGRPHICGQHRCKMVNFYNWVRPRLDRSKRLGKDVGLYHRHST
jgi:hypothetical protein